MAEKRPGKRQRFLKTITPPCRRGFTFEPLNSILQEFPYHFLIKTRVLAKFINSNELVLLFAKHFTDQLKEMLGRTNTTTGNVLYIPGMNNDSLWYDFFQWHNTLYESYHLLKLKQKLIEHTNQVRILMFSKQAFTQLNNIQPGSKPVLINCCRNQISIQQKMKK